nr:hypothetical protein [Xanthomonas fragariae]
MLEIYAKPTSINVRKVLWLCKELALDYTLHAYGSGLESVDRPSIGQSFARSILTGWCR